MEGRYTGQGKIVDGKTASRRITGARFIAETLKGYGVTHVFYVPAVMRNTLVEMEALGIRRVLTHSEKAAAYMADGYARVSHKPGICMAQSVGAANLASGLQDPYLGLSPVIAMTGRKPAIAQYRNAYQEIFHHPMFEPVTKYNVSVNVPEQLPYLLRQAFREATSGAPAPVHLDFEGYAGELIEQSEGEFDVIVEDTFKRYPSFRPEPTAREMENAIRFIMDSERPVIVAGGGVISSSAQLEIVKFAEMHSIPVVTSLNGKGSIPENHPLSVGVVGSYSRWCANKIVSEADLVMFIGSHTGDQVTNNWTVPPKETTVIQIDVDPLELGRNYCCRVPLMGDAKATLFKLIEVSKNKVNGNRRQWVKKSQYLVKEWEQEFSPMMKSDVSPIRVERLCKEITANIPSDGILVSDTGYASYWTGTMVHLTHPAQSYIRAAGSLGWAFPASLGAKCGAPNRSVICFTGDGGFWYHLSELETAIRLGINTVTIVNNNHCLRQCLEGVNRAYKDRPGNREEMYMFKEVNFARIAEEIGCLGIRIEHPREIAGALRKAFSNDSPVVIDVVTDPMCKVPRI